MLGLPYGVLRWYPVLAFLESTTLRMKTGLSQDLSSSRDVHESSFRTTAAMHKLHGLIEVCLHKHRLQGEQFAECC